MGKRESVADKTQKKKQEGDKQQDKKSTATTRR